MPARESPLLVASFGNAMAGDDAFGCLVGRRIQSLKLPEVEIVEVGMQPFKLLHLLSETRQGLVVVDACLATPVVSPGRLLDLDYFVQHDIQLVHDMVLSTHGLSIADEVELARGLGILPPRVRFVTGSVEQSDLGCPMTPALKKLVRPAVQSVVRIVREWSAQIRSYCHA